jgi:hypothetical protein
MRPAASCRELDRTDASEARNVVARNVVASNIVAVEFTDRDNHGG